MKTVNEMVELLLTEKTKSPFEKMKDNKVPLTPEERTECMKAKAVWHQGPGGAASPAVWKSVHPDTKKVTYVSSTHRCYQQADTLKGAIAKYFSVVKDSA